ncbi:FYVE, RhoGEF and PH domain-containing protein 6 [Bulinus truncatus]|nr:FYVE, RhoGEF and PH domain-containing protein 6 [Bulinus truncatus]
MTSLSVREDEASLRMIPFSNISNNKPQPARSPEKPPVAAKPKLAPPPPPKPFTSPLHTSKLPVTQTGGVNVILTNTKYQKESPVKNTCNTVSDKALNGMAVETPTAKSETESLTEASCNTMSLIKPPLPTSPPRVPNRVSLSPSSSSSLPASFRRKNFGSALLSAKSQIQVSPGISSPPLSPTLSPTSQPVQETLPTKMPPSTLPKPNVSSVTKLWPSYHDSSVKTLEVSNVQTLNHTPSQGCEKTPGDHEVASLVSSDLNSLNDILSLAQFGVVSAPSASIHLITESSTRTDKKMPSRPSKPPFILKLPSSGTGPALETAAQSLTTPDIDTPAAKVIPPPLPKNPPRGNVPRKTRSTGSKRTPTSEVRPVSPACDQSEAVVDTVIFQGDKVKFTNLTEDSHSDCVPNDNEHIAHSVKETSKTAPRPRPRTRVRRTDQSALDHIVRDDDSSATDRICLHSNDQIKLIGSPIELDYVEVYRGETEQNDADSVVDSVNTSFKHSEIIGRESAISQSIPYDHNSTDSSDKHLNESSSFHEEPEATCGMLKEIEELLKTKLGGDIRLDTDTLDFSYPQTEGHQETRDDRSTPSSSPVRPPRPKHKASLDRNIGSFESLSSSIDSTSTEFLSSAGLQTTGKKIPPKPKRSFVGRINRSHSDVSDLKGGDQGITSLQGPADRPFLPPRSDSLRRGESLSSTTPPPLPPRNKPQTCTASTEALSDSETVIMSSAAYQEGTSDSSNQSGSSGTLRRSDKPTPKRQAPPPPPGPPKRSSTFSPGDVRLQKRESSSHNLSADSISSQRRLSIPDYQEQVYHEISDHLRTNRDAESPPPVLPPRSSGATKGQDKNEKLFWEKGKTPLAKTLSPEDQKIREKKDKTALIHRVTQSLGLSKPSKKNKPVELNNEITSSRSNSFEAKVEKAPEPNVTVEISHPAPIPTADTTTAAHAEDNSLLDTTKRTLDSAAIPSLISQQNSSSSEGKTDCFDHQALEEMPSSESESEPEPDKEEIYAQRKAKKVFFIAKEIMSSENNFVDVLKLLNLDFRIHISGATEKFGQPVIPSEQLNKILDLLPQLLTFNEDLLKDIKGRLEKWDIDPRISDIFVKKGPFLKLYSTYISNFENATALLESATKRNPIFAEALREFELSPRCSNLALKHYMLKPIQRIPQYKLLLQDYLKNLSPSSPDYKDTVTALNIVSEVADHANESMRQGDNVQNLLEVQRSLIGQFEVIQPGRVLIKKGELQKLSRKEMQPRMFILFSDVLLHTTPTTTGYKINNILPLIGMKVCSPKLEVYKFEFNIICVQRSFTLSASTSKEKEEWVSALQTAIETNAKKHHTFEAYKPGPQTSLHDKDFVLGSKAPLWVPDARVTMCMLCLVEFTLTWRRHHCRSCGRIVCSQCSDNKAPLRYLKDKPARVCDKCFDTLKAALVKEIEESKDHSARSSTSQSEDNSSSLNSVDGAGGSHESIKNLNDLLQRFQKIRISNRKANTPSRPSVLKEVQANDEGSDISGYLRAYKSRKWKKLWFVVKGKVLYTYKASEDMAAVESMPLLGYEVTRLNVSFEGAEPDHLFELTHQNKQPLSNNRGEKTTQRLIFRTENVEDTINKTTNEQNFTSSHEQSPWAAFIVKYAILILP